MTTANEIRRHLTAQLAHSRDGLPVILTDAEALDRAADAAGAAGARLHHALEEIHRTWRGVPRTVRLSTGTGPLEAGMDRPAALADAVRATTAETAAALREYAVRVRAARRDFAALTRTAEHLIQVAAASIGPATGLGTDYSPMVETTADADGALLAAYETFESDLRRRIERWSEQQRDTAARLNAARNAVPAGVLLGGTGIATRGLTGSEDALGADGRFLDAETGVVDVHAPVTGMVLGARWLLGMGPRHVVLDGTSEFARQVRDDRTALHGTPLDLADTMRTARRAARMELSAGGWSLHEPLSTPQGRSLTGARAIPTFVQDAVTVGVADETAGLVDLGTDQSFLGSYGLEMVPIAVVGTRSVLMRVTVTNATTLASGTRVPLLETSGDALGHAKDVAVATGPASEQTQTITWTEVVSYPARRATASRR